MKKLLLLLLFIPLISCFDDDDNKDSLLTIANSANEDFIITQIAFTVISQVYEFSDLDIQYGQSQTYNLGPNLSSGPSTNPNVPSLGFVNMNITYSCGSQGWTSTRLVNLNEGSTTLFSLVGCFASEYCRRVCLVDGPG